MDVTTNKICDEEALQLTEARNEPAVQKIIAHKTLEERLTAFYGKPIDQIEKIPQSSEIEWGDPKGAEK